MNRTAVKLDLAECAAVGTGQFRRDVGGSFPYHPFLDPRAQGTPDGMSIAFDLAEMNRPAAPSFGGLEVGRRLCRLPHQPLQFLPQGFDPVVHE